MASSSRTKKQRSSVSQSKQGTSSLESNPLNLPRLLADDEQHKVFRIIFMDAQSSYLNSVMQEILTTKYFCFCYESTDIYPKLVHVFYNNMNFRKNHLTSFVNGKDISLDAKTFSSLCCNIPFQGSTIGLGLVCYWDNYDRKEFYYSLCGIFKEEIEQRKHQGFGETVKNRDILYAGYLKLEDHDNAINVGSSQIPLPYAIFITKILEHFGVSTAGETKVALSLRENKIDVEFVHKMGFSIDPHDRRTYKHRTDRPTAPTTDQPEPTNPNPLEFHAESSSYASMPSNKMIMDQLFSLRGYITNQMDALDAQSQQIHYELYHLSSRLSSMDVDEDSSELES
ncbi:hypothetical protein Lal_00039815 [Lupinus albus]|nr:hypothetical protein Lal_00039815 [Lupinus albus]